MIDARPDGAAQARPAGTLPDADGGRGTMLVTGGSRGIGAAVARRAAREGWDVAILYRSRADDAAAVVADVESAGRRAVAVRGDVASEADLLRAFEAADRLGPLTALVANAGITGGVARVEALDAGTLDAVLRVNVWAAFVCAREAVRRMSTRRGGRGGTIVAVGSGASQLGNPGVWVHYAASKGAIDTMTIGLSKEVAGEGIRVNCVRPGLIDTEIHADRPPGQWDELLRSVPMGRAGTADEVAKSIVWLADDAASPYVTGCLLDVRGGR